MRARFHGEAEAVDRPEGAVGLGQAGNDDPAFLVRHGSTSAVVVLALSGWGTMNSEGGYNIVKQIHNGDAAASPVAHEALMRLFELTVGAWARRWRRAWWSAA